MSILIQILKRKKSIIFFLITFFSVLISFSQEVTKERVGNSPEKHINATRGPGTGASILVPNDDNQHGGTPKELVENILASSCVEVVSARFGYYDKVNDNWVTNFGNNTLERQLGYFNEGAAQNFPIEEGLLLSTGEIQNAMGPSASEGFSDEMERRASDPDLTLITNRILFDAAVLEIDFIPVGDNIEFQFIFASDEYLEYCGTEYEDIFGFFLSGPGVSGGVGYQNDAVNLAELPNGDPITINTIHPAVQSNVEGNSVPASNEAYYANNNYAISTEFDGGTVILTAKYLGVTSGSQYKMKLAIADASDQKWDAGMFLQAKSFSTVDAGSYGSVCVDGADITLVGSPLGGVWSGTGVTGNTFDPSVGTQTLTYTYTEGNTCSDSDTTTITVNDLPVVDAGNYGPVCIDGADITLVGSPLGGTWNGIGVTDNGDGTAIFDPTVANAGNAIYTYTDENTCADSDLTTITVNDLPVVDAGSYGPVCIDGADITLVGSPVGGVWSGTGVTGNTFDPSVGTQTLTYTYTNTNDCTNTDDTIIEIYESPTADITSPVNVLCFGDATGEATVTVEGGTAPYTYSWDNGQTEATATGLVAGDYIVTVTDNNGCTTTATATIEQPVAALSVSITSEIDVLCYGEATGSATALAAGGTAPYTYSWDNGQTEATATGLVAGDYVVTVTDANGNATTCSATATATIEQPVAALSVSITSEIDVLCYGEATGSATALAAGGTAPYTYSWDNGQTEATATGLVAGDYVVTVTDANGNATTCSATATATIEQPVAALSVSITSEIDVLCYGEATGSATALAAGGTAPYTYSWDNGQTEATATGLVAGDYVVTVTDANGNATTCSATATATIEQPVAALSVSITSEIDVLCYGEATGSATALAAGGTAPYTYSWDNGQTEATATGLVAGDYVVTVTDANGNATTCSATATATIEQPVAALSVSITSEIDVLCYGEATGSATALAAGGTAPYTYSWDNGQTEATATGLVAGDYVVTVTDANGNATTCSATATATIEQPVAALSVSITSEIDVLCYGEATGSATALAAGGTAPYTYSWDNGQTEATATGLVAGDYVVTVTDANGNATTCSATATATIEQPVAALSVSITSEIDVLCYGEATGSATALAAGGTAPYTYSWDNGQTEATATGLVAGDYVVTVTDANGNATTCSATATATIEQPVAALSVSITSEIDVLCYGEATGSATALAAGGTAPYTYSWDNGQTEATATGLVAGDYVVTVTDANGNATTCSATATATIEQPVAALSVSITSEIDVLCYGEATGSATALAAGGTAPYTYSWDNGQTEATATGLVAGDYVVTVTDANGNATTCSATATATIEQPVAALSVSITSEIDVLCYGEATGSATALAAGGTAPYTYSWDNGQTEATATGLVAGDYVVTVTDANGNATTCSATATATIEQPVAALSVSITSEIDVLCYGEATGSATALAAGGTAPYTYSWDNGQTEATATGLVAGDYVVTVTDANGNATTCSATATATIEQPVAALSVSITSEIDVLCYGEATGSATALAAGGTAPYTYSWDNGQTEATATGLVAGDYVVTVTDANGNATTCSATATATIEQPVAALSVSITSEIDVLCYGEATGSATALAAGGTAPYTYSWDNGQTEATATGLVAGDYVVTVTDANGNATTCSATATATIEQPVAALSVSITSEIDVLCYGEATGSATALAAGGTAPYTYSWDNGQTEATATGLVAGDYVVTVTDANGNATTCSATATATIEQPVAALSVSITSEIDVLCYGEATGSATALAAGGTAPYTYSWDNGQTEATATGLVAGDYVVTVTDANGNATTCSATATATIEQPVAALSVSITSEIDVLCYGEATGSATALAAGGTAPYTYSWDNGQTEATATGLVAGDYVVTVTDANGNATTCSATATATIEQPVAALSVSITSEIDVLCYGEATGSATALAAGGTAPYTYSWDNGQTEATATGLVAGDYVVTVTDANGNATTCSATATATIEQPVAALSVSITSEIDVLCYGEATGSATALAAGGTAPYTYSWDNGQTEATATGLVAGDYVVTVTDANGNATTCSATATATIEQPVAALSVSITSEIDVLCYGEATGSATALAAGGTAPYTYSWDNGQTEATATGLVAGDYVVTVTDANGNATTCSATATATIEQPVAALSVSITSEIDVLCYGEATGSATALAAGGTAPYTYSWDNGQTEATATGLVAGDYVVTVTDANGCTTTAEVTIAQPSAPLTIEITSQEDELCYGDANGAVDITVSGGTPGYLYLWTTIDGSGLDPNAEDQTGLTAGTYEVEITDANGCTITETVIIDGPQSALTITITSQVNELCFGDANGEINISVSGGTTEYSYLWSNGQPTQDLFNLYPGTYSVLVTDTNGCTATASTTITGPDEELTSEITSQTAVLCYEDNSGEIDLTVNGGTPDYTYLWSTTDGSGLVVDAEDQTELSAGTYEVLITDENGCVTNNIVMISEAQSGLDATIISQVDMECVGSGSVIIEANGGTLPYEFTLNGVTTQNNGSFNDLAEGNNTIIVEDANGCSFTVPVFIVNKCIGLVKEVELFDDDGDNCADEGEELHYTFTVNNMGNVELTDVIITDPLVTVTGGPITLQPGEIDATTFTADYMITENDVVNIGEVVNQATAFGTTPSDENVSDLSDNENFLEDDPTVFDNFCKVIVNAPTIAIIKEAMIVDENDNGCPDIGETILYTFKVKNTSTEEELINVVIIDPMVEVLGSPITLSIGGIDTDTFTALHTITQEDLDATYIDNQAMAIGTGSDSQLSAEDLSHETSFTEDGFTTVYFCQPALGIELEKSGQWNDENGDGGADEGETISYTFSVTNTGDEPLYNITLEDPLPGIVMEGGPIEVLMPLQTDDTSFTATYTLSQEDVDNLEVINQATVTGENNNGNSVITEVSDDPSTVEENDPTVIILPDVGGVLFEIFNGITPNGDGFNDYFQIDGIDQFSNNNVKIFNRWGILIFETNGYNESSNVFKGESNARATIEGDRDVPTGTYFYIITFPDVNPGKDSYSGYLYINR